MQQHSQNDASNMAAPQLAGNTGCRPIPKIPPSDCTSYPVQNGVRGLFFCLPLFLVGFASPAWLGPRGLWTPCDCARCFCGNPYLLSAVRAVEVLALLSLLVCMGVALYQEVFTTPPVPDNKAVEILAALAGILGLTGVIIFGTITSSEPYKYYYRWVYPGRLNWAFGLTAVSSVLLLLCGCVLATSRVRHAARTTAIMAAKGFYLLPAGVVYVPPATSGHPAYPHNHNQAGYPTSQAAYPNSQAAYPNSQAAYPNSQAAYPECPAPYPDARQSRQASGRASYPATPRNSRGAFQPPPLQAVSLERGGIYPTLAAYYAAHLPAAGPMTSQVATAPPASQMHDVNEGASTSSTPCSPTKKTAGIATSSVPVCYVVNEGKTIPVFDEIPEVIVTAAP